MPDFNQDRMSADESPHASLIDRRTIDVGYGSGDDDDDSPGDILNNNNNNGGGSGCEETEGETVFLSVDAALGSEEAKPFQARLLTALFFANGCDAVEVLSVGFILPVYTDPSGSSLTNSQSEYLTAAVFVGMLVGGLASGSVSDRVGRRFALVSSLVCNFVAAALSALAPTTEALIGCRVLAGLAVGASVPALFTCAAELFPPTKRGAYVTVISSAWMIGSMVTAGLAWALLGDDSSSNDDDDDDGKDGNGDDDDDDNGNGKPWRTFAAACALFPMAAAALCFLFVPESPRFLVAQGKVAEAVSVLEKEVLQAGRKPSPCPQTSALQQKAKSSAAGSGGGASAAAAVSPSPSSPSSSTTRDRRQNRKIVSVRLEEGNRNGGDDDTKHDSSTTPSTSTTTNPLIVSATAASNNNNNDEEGVDQLRDSSPPSPRSPDHLMPSSPSSSSSSSSSPPRITTLLSPSTSERSTSGGGGGGGGGGGDSGMNGGDCCSERQRQKWTGSAAAAMSATFADWSELANSPATRKPFMALVSVWVCLSFGYYGLATWITVLFDSVGLDDPYVASFLYCAANLPGNLLVLLAVDRLGRRPLLLVSMLGAAASALLFAFASGGGGGSSSDNTVVVVVAAMLFNAWCTSAWDVVNVVTTEAFPTQLRATALGLLAACGRLGSVVAQFVNGSLQTNVALLLAVTSGTMLLGAAAAAALPRNQSAAGIALD